MNWGLVSYNNLDLEKQLYDHVASCSDCQHATSIRNACPEAKIFHDQIVKNAQVNAQAKEFFRARLIDLNEVSSLRRGQEAIREIVEDVSVATIQGIDVSQWQGTFNWNEAVSAGIGLGIAKATEGNGFTDPQWGNNVAALLAPGPLVGGSYHFGREDLGNAASAEADWYLNQHPPQCFSPTLPWVFSLDAEYNGGTASWVYAFLDAVSNKIGYSCWFYSFANWITSRGIQAYNRPLWIAWPNPPPPPNLGWPVVTMQQYGTRNFSVGAVDADEFFGDKTTLYTLAGLDTPQPPNPDPPKPITGEVHVGRLAFRPGGPNDRFDVVFAYSEPSVSGGIAIAHAWGDSISGLVKGQNADGSPTGWQSLGAPTLPAGVSLVPGTEEYAWDATGASNMGMAQASDGTWWYFYGDLSNAFMSGWLRMKDYVSIVAPQKGKDGVDGAPGAPGPATYIPHKHVFTETQTSDAGTPEAN